MIVPVFLPHLGCGDRCIYCDQASITDLRTSDVKATIEAHLGRMRQPAEVGLFGGNVFGIGAEALKRLFSYFEPYRERITGFRISTKPIPLDEEIIAILKENEVKVIELGIPSFNDEILRAINRRHTAEDARRSFARLKAEGFTVALQVMVDLPGETWEDIRETTENLISLAPDYIRIYPLAVLKGTPLEDLYREGRYVPIPFDEAVERTVHIYLSLLKYGIKTVKMGLTDNEVIAERVVAGHYHPAFGYLVKSRAFRNAILKKLREAEATGAIRVTLNKRDIPHLLGHKRENLTRFKGEGFEVAWEMGEMEQGTFVLRWDGGNVGGDVFDALGEGSEWRIVKSTTL